MWKIKDLVKEMKEVKDEKNKKFINELFEFLKLYEEESLEFGDGLSKEEKDLIRDFVGYIIMNVSERE